MASLNATLAPPPHYDLRATVRAHGWKDLAPFQWDANSGELRFAALVGAESIDVSVRQKGGVELTLESHRRLKKSQQELALQQVRRSLDLDFDTTVLLATASDAGAHYEKMIRGGAGRRLRSASLWEDAAKTLFTTNCTWVLTKKMCAAACSEQFCARAPSGNIPFPGPQAFSSHDAAALKSLLPVGYRAAFFKALAQRFAADPLLNDLESPATAMETAYETINALDGFGPYATSHMMMMAGHYQHIPVDTVATTFVREAFGARKAESFIRKRYAKWGLYQFWGYRLDQLIHWGIVE